MRCRGKDTAWEKGDYEWYIPGCIRERRYRSWQFLRPSVKEEEMIGRKKESASLEQRKASIVFIQWAAELWNSLLKNTVVVKIW